jgi:LacI family transcriptional regulator
MALVKNARPTMREVAALSGTSIKTVSRVFNEVSTVDPELVEKVKKAAKKLNYTPNIAAGNLRRSNGHTKTIGLLLDDVSNPFSAALNRKYEDLASLRGYTVFAGSLEEDVNREKELVSLFVSRRVDGLVMVPVASDHSFLKAEMKAGMHFGFIDRIPQNFPGDVVLSTNEKSTREAINNFITLGHKKIAFFGDNPHLYTSEERYNGYVKALRSAKIPLNKKWVIRGENNSEEIIKAAIAILTPNDRPTAIFTGQNMLTLNVYRALRELGLTNKVALIGYDDFEGADLMTPALSLIRQNVDEMAKQSAQMLFERIEGYSGGVREILVSTDYIPRGSGEIKPS